MPLEDQLEIIGPAGEIRFHPLNAGKGVTYLGSHPDSDVVLEGPEIAPFHALLDHRTRPYHLTLMAESAAAAIDGAPLPANTPRPVENWGSLSLGAYTVILLQAGAARPFLPQPATAVPGLALITTTPADETAQAPSTQAVATTEDASAPIVHRPKGPVSPPPDRTDEVIVTDVSAREWTVAVDQTAVAELTIANGGDIVAAFNVTVDGVDPTWVTITPPTANLNEGARATVLVAITPPRLSSSEAGAYPVSIDVTSPNHPSRVSRRGGLLIVSPFYEYAVGDLSPRQQSLPWRKKSGEAVVPIVNKGNSETPFRVEAEDDEHGCRFEFQAPGEATALVRQAEFRVPAGENLPVPVRITPLRRRVVALGKHMYPYTITTTMLEGGQTPRTVMGQLSAGPLFGPWMVMLFMLLIAAIVAMIFRPTISQFKTNSELAKAGDRVVLSWSASPWASLRVDPEVGAVPGPDGSVAVTATQNTTFKLTAENVLTRINAAWFGETREVKVVVEPVEPVIKTFTSDKTAVLTGGSATIFWDVQFTEKLSLITNGVEETLPPTEYAGKRAVTPSATSTYGLVATNRYGTQRQNLQIQVNVPTPTPLPLPVVERFDVQPQVITAGQSIKIDWTTSGVKSVQIAPLPDTFPPSGSISDTPDKTTAYVLTASNGQTETKIIRQVTVNPAPPAPLAPKIEFFTVTPDSVVRGSAAAADVKLSWSIIGDITNIEISGPDFGKVSNLDRVGTLSVSVDKTMLYVLTAYNGTLLASLPINLKVVEPTPTPVPPTPVPPAPSIIFFRAESGESPAAPDQVQPVSTSTLPSNTLKYQVIAGSKVKFSWQVQQNPAKVTFVNIGDQPFQGDLTLVVRAAGIYQLKAENGGGVSTAFVQVELKPKPAPPAPYNVAGTYTAVPPLNIRWEYNPIFQDSITGFRVYRADTPGTTFRRVADESQLVKTERQFNDVVSPTCGRIYYVVAVYYDVVADAVKETAPSGNSWASLTCSATPTRTP